MIRLFLADDHTLFREGIKQILSEYQDISVKGEAENGNETLQSVFRENYDVIILDISLPDINGMEILRQIKDRKPDSRVLMLSMYSEEQYAMKAFRSGASGYLTKSEAPHELISAIRKISEGGTYISVTTAEKMVSQLNEFQEKPKHTQLSEREYEVMLKIASGEKLNEIAQDLKLSSSTISTIRQRVLKKMEMESNADLTRYVLKEKLLSP